MRVTIEDVHEISYKDHRCRVDYPGKSLAFCWCGWICYASNRLDARVKGDSHQRDALTAEAKR